MKKLVLLMPLFYLVACAQQSAPRYDEFRAYPVPDSLVVAQGQSSFIETRFEIPRGASIYGNPKGPGTGKPTEVTVTADPAFRVEESRYLKPVKHYARGEKEFTWVYRNETYIFTPFTVRRDARPGDYAMTVQVDALLCTDSTCIPQLVSFRYPVTVTAPGGAVTRINDFVIDRFRSAAQPAAVHDGSVPAQGGTGQGVQADGGALRDLRAITFSPRFTDQGIGGIIQAILFGLLAGLLLNIMPCVLPVVSLKVMGFVQHAGKNRKELVKLGALFAAGILTSFALLASLAVFLDYSWGGLFQHRVFLVGMIALVFMLALSMFDVYVINIPSFAGAALQNGGNPHLDSYTKGLLATLLATPCSGPFLGGTLAWALLQSPLVIFLIFMSIGLGMALPYLLLALFPRFLALVPKPGNWMITFERIMGFLLLFTVVYLITILDDASIRPTLVFLGFLGIGVWQFGKYGSIQETRGRRLVSLAVLVALAAGGYAFSFSYLYRDGAARSLAGSEFSLQRLYSDRDQGKIALVKFTADWCPNCKFVEGTALNTSEVARRIEELGIDFMTADITRAHPEAQALLKSLGGNAIPFLALFPPGSDFNRPWCLRDIYSEKEVLRIIGEAARQRGSEAARILPIRGAPQKFEIRLQ